MDLEFNFLYTLLSLPKIFSKILPFIYFVSIFYIILKYENNNELIIFWDYWYKKIRFCKYIIKIFNTLLNFTIIIYYIYCS